MDRQTAEEMRSNIEEREDMLRQKEDELKSREAEETTRQMTFGKVSQGCNSIDITGRPYPQP